MNNYNENVSYKEHTSSPYLSQLQNRILVSNLATLIGNLNMPKVQLLILLPSHVSLSKYYLHVPNYSGHIP